MSASRGRDAVLAQLNVSRETAARLDAYVRLLTEWQARVNLVAADTLGDVWERHILDSGQLLAHAEADQIRWVDLGSGAGFPGLVISLLLHDRGGSVVLIESNLKKAAFLREAARRTGAPAHIEAQRVEDVLIARRIARCDIVTARAVAPLPALISLAAPLLSQGATGLFLKGKSAAQELTAARESWTIEADLQASVTHPDGRIVRIVSLAPRRGDP